MVIADTSDSVSLLREYVASGSEAAFRQLVGRHLDLVYSTALRLVGGDSHLAQDVAQSVFTDVARLAPRLTATKALGGWLYRHTVFTASKAVRTERRRREREGQAVAMNTLNDNSDAAWRQLAPVLDEAMKRLGAEERDALVLRFFEGQSFRAVGATLGTSEEGARKRVERAVDKLRAQLGRCGVALSAAALATALTTQAVAVAPAGLAATVASASLASAATAGSLTLITKLMTMTKLKIVTGAAVLTTGLATPLVLQHQANARLREENRVLSEQAAQIGELDRLRAENARLAKPPAEATNEQFLELMRLRGEVGLLKSQVADINRIRQENDRLRQRVAALAQRPAPGTEGQDPAVEQQKQVGIAKLSYAKGWVFAFHQYADKNNGQFPTDFAQAAPYFPPSAQVGEGYQPDQYEIVYQGSWANITNPSPAQTIVIREKQAMPSVNGGWIRAYGFADGHTEIHSDPTGNFQPWESTRMYPPAGR